MSTKKDCRLVQVWVPLDVVRRLECHLRAQVAGLSAKPDRQAWIVEAIQTALSDAASPVLAAHRGRLADAEAPPIEEVRP